MKFNYSLTDREIKGKNWQTAAFYISFLIWPFGVMLTSLRNREKRVAMNIFWFFNIFLGLTFIISSEGLDAARYAQKLHEFHGGQTSWKLLLNSLYSEEGNLVDIVQPIITYFVSRFTDNTSILFGIFCLIFGYFYSRNVWFLFDQIGQIKISISIFIFILTYILLIPFWNGSNAFRMWTAAHLFIYGLLPYLFNGNKKRLLWAFSSVLVHFSFLLPVTVLLLYILLGNRIHFYFGFFLATIFFQALDLGLVREMLGFLPGFLKQRVFLYVNPQNNEMVISGRQSLNWYLPMSRMVLTFVVYLFSFLAYWKDKKKMNKHLLNLFCFGMWFYSWANIANLIPSGDRFTVIANMIMMLFIILYLLSNPQGKIIHFIKAISAFSLLIFVIVSIRMGFECMSLSSLLGNPIFTLFVEDSYPLINYIKNLI